MGFCAACSKALPAGHILKLPLRRNSGPDSDIGWVVVSALDAETPEDASKLTHVADIDQRILREFAALRRDGEALRGTDGGLQTFSPPAV